MTDGPSVGAGRPAGPARDVAATRVSAGIVAGGCLGLLGVAWALEPDGAGHGTHEQLGLPSCMWMSVFEAPCPTCGMTTAFSHAARGSLLDSLVAQPLGGVLAIGTATVFWLALHSATTGSRALAALSSAMGFRAAWIGIAALGVAWGYKLVTHSG